MFWTPPDHIPGDITIIHDGEAFHLFTEQFLRNPESDILRERTIGHYRSTDMVSWETLPTVCGVGEPGSFDGLTLFHSDAYIHEGKWYVHYTALDIKGPGQRQSVGLCISDDGLNFKKISDKPILEADPRWYEQAIPDEACYQEKDRGRLWFRDPAIIQDPDTGQFGLTIIARDKAVHPDRNGCLAWAVSDDLINWEPRPPIFSPRRFHTIETPSIFEKNGKHYIIYMSHPAWGGPVMTNDPYQQAGNFYAYSESGPEGPYITPEDEVLVATHGYMRMGAQRTVCDPDGQFWHYGWMRTPPIEEDGDINPGHPIYKVMPPFRPVKFADNGEMHVMAAPHVEAETTEQKLQADLTVIGNESDWRVDGNKIHGKQLRDKSVAMFPGEYKSVIFSAKVQLHYGERVGLIVRANDEATEGWECWSDHRHGRAEYTLPGRDLFIDARKWTKRDTYELKVIANAFSVEVYIDNRLLIQNVRHCEVAGRVGLMVENADVSFSDVKLKTFNKEVVIT